jgi:hypothetical protein
MPGEYLTDSSNIICPHGGNIMLQTSNTRVKSDNTFVLLETDTHTVSGCPFTLPNNEPSPCVRIEWSNGSSVCSINGTPILKKESIGNCYSPKNVMQGIAIIINTQMKVKTR